MNLLEYADTLKIIDTHEHLPSHEKYRSESSDFLAEYISQYFGRDLMSAGLSESNWMKAMDSTVNILERWKLLEPYWNYARFTGYGRQLDKTVKILYGIDKISKTTIEELNQKFLDSRNGTAYYHVLKEKCKIETAVLDSDLECDKNYFVSALRLDDFIFPRNWSAVKNVERMVGFQICCFNDWLDACEVYLDHALKKGAVCLKAGLAYGRPLFFERVTKAEAEQEFNELFKYNHDSHVSVTGKRAQDYMMHYVLKMANRRGLVYQFHTGLLSGNGNRIENANPELMTNLFLDYPNVKFDIFHIGYPYQNVLSALSKMFPNVYIDMCWSHVISPFACQSALEEWIDSVPINKISAFGGDSSFVDSVAGHLQMAKENVVSCLYKKIKDNIIDENEAKYIMEQLFYENPKNLFLNRK